MQSPRDPNDLNDKFYEEDSRGFSLSIEEYNQIATNLKLPSGVGTFPQQNRIRGESYVTNRVFKSSYDRHFLDYPRMHRLFKAKQNLIDQTNHPSMSIQRDIFREPLQNFHMKFDVILVEPPPWVSFDDLQKLDIKSITPNVESRRTNQSSQNYNQSYGQNGYNQNYNQNQQNYNPNYPQNQHFTQSYRDMNNNQHSNGEQYMGRSFLFLWCDCTSKLEKARETLKKWGYRFAEEIVWIKTIPATYQHSKPTNFFRKPGQVFSETKEYCLMGIYGNIRRNVDVDFVHSNCDPDIIIHEPIEHPVRYAKPNEIFDIIERFCLGRRRVHLFGREDTRRDGWLTIGEHVDNHFDYEQYMSYFDSSILTGTNTEIEKLRPKSPILKRQEKILAQRAREAKMLHAEQHAALKTARRKLEFENAGLFDGDRENQFQGSDQFAENGKIENSQMYDQNNNYSAHFSQQQNANMIREQEHAVHSDSHQITQFKQNEQILPDHLDKTSRFDFNDFPLPKKEEWKVKSEEGDNNNNWLAEPWQTSKGLLKYVEQAADKQWESKIEVQQVLQTKIPTIENSDTLISSENFQKSDKFLNSDNFSSVDKFQAKPPTVNNFKIGHWDDITKSYGINTMLNETNSNPSKSSEMCSNNPNLKNSSQNPGKIQNHVMIQSQMNTPSDPSRYHESQYNQNANAPTTANERSFDPDFRNNVFHNRIQVNSSMNNSTRTQPNQAFSNQPNLNHYHSEEHHNEIAKQNLDQQFANLRLKEYEKTIKTIHGTAEDSFDSVNIEQENEGDFFKF